MNAMQEPVASSRRLSLSRSRLFPRIHAFVFLAGCIDINDDRHTGSQPIKVTLVVLEDYLYRNSLHDLCEVARSIVRRQQRELRTACGRDLDYVTFQPQAGKRIDSDHR